jgi:hypothetical protein
MRAVLLLSAKAQRALRLLLMNSSATKVAGTQNNYLTNAEETPHNPVGLP